MWGGETAVTAVQQHFNNVFAKTALPTRDDECEPYLATMRASMDHMQPTPITPEELITSINKLKPGKTSGPTGMSNEFLQALSASNEGLEHLLTVLNNSFSSGTLPSDLHVGIACLIPKCQHIQKPEQIRPILLLEVVQKLYAAILMRRLQPHWPPLTAQLGAVSGGQPIEALFAAHYMVSIVEVSAATPIFVKLDIRGAFDNLSHASVAAFLATMPSRVAFEAHRLMKLLMEQRFLFTFFREEWAIQISNGTPQGGSHSAGLFARTLDHNIGKVTAQWEAAGHTPVFSPIWLLLFVDGILLTFKNWAQATSLLPSLLAALNQVGLNVNFDKSCIVAHADTLSNLPPKHLLGVLADFQWTTHTQYLRKPLGYHLGHDTVVQSALRLIHQAWGRMKPILNKCHWSQPAATKCLLDKYVGSCFLWLSPILFPHKSTLHRLQVIHTTIMVESLHLYIPNTSDKEAYQLQRTRRHVVREWPSQATQKQTWPTQYLRRFWSFLGHICRQEFHSHHPARVMLAHVADRHAGGLARHGPWHTTHSLLRKFWAEKEIEHDYLYLAHDRDAWKLLGATFLKWMDQPMKSTKAELLLQNPWESKGALLRQQTNWLHTAILNIHGTTLLLTWLDTVEGPSRLSIDIGHPHSAATILENYMGLERHLRILYQPFVQQLAISQPEIWNLLHTQEQCCHERLLRGQTAWYQLFPLSPREVTASVMQPFIL